MRLGRRASSPPDKPRSIPRRNPLNRPPCRAQSPGVRQCPTSHWCLSPRVAQATGDSTHGPPRTAVVAASQASARVFAYRAEPRPVRRQPAVPCATIARRCCACCCRAAWQVSVSRTPVFAAAVPRLQPPVPRRERGSISHSQSSNRNSSRAASRAIRPMTVKANDAPNVIIRYHTPTRATRP